MSLCGRILVKYVAYSDAADGYGVTECGSLACLSNPCRNGGRCVEMQRGNNNNIAKEDYDNTIGLSSSSALNRRGQQRHMSHDNTKPSKTSRWAAPSPVASLSLLGKEDEEEQRFNGIIPGQSSSSRMQSDYRAARAEEDEGDYFELEDNRNWQCKCPTGYIGPTCEISVCDNNPCQYGGTCIPYPGSGYLCLCPFGKHGHYCEHSEYKLQYFILEFSSSRKRFEFMSKRSGRFPQSYYLDIDSDLIYLACGYFSE